MTQYGKPLKESDFLLLKGAVFLNQGSYGTIPKVVQQERFRYDSKVFPLSFLALFEYVSRAHEIEIRPSSVRSSVRR